MVEIYTDRRKKGKGILDPAVDAATNAVSAATNAVKAHFKPDEAKDKIQADIIYKAQGAKAANDYMASRGHLPTDIGPPASNVQDKKPIATPSREALSPQPLRERTPISATERWRAMGEQSKATIAAANQAPEPLPNNTFNQTDAYTRRRVADTTQSAGIGTGGAGVVGGTFQPRDTDLGRRQLGLPSRAEQNAQRVRSSGPGQSILRQGQTRLNLPAANAERMAARDIERSFEQQRRRSSREGAVVGDRNARSFDSMMDNMTSRRNIDVNSAVQRRGQDVTARGQDISAATQYRGQDITARGQDLSYSSSLRGQDVTMRGQDQNYDSTLRGQDLNYDSTVRGQDVNMRNTDVTNENANLRNRESNDTQRYGYDSSVQMNKDRVAANKYASELTQNTAIRADSDRQLEGFAFDRKTGAIDQRTASRYKSVRDDLLSSGIAPKNMEQVVQVSKFFDEFNSMLDDRGDKNYVTASNFMDPDNKAKLVKLGFWDALMSFDLGSREQVDLPGAGLFPQDELDQPLDYGTTETLGLRGRQ